MPEKTVLIPLFENTVAPRFDLATVALIVALAEDGAVASQQTLLLAHASPEELCDLILKRDIPVVVCCGIEEEYYHYLRWKRVEVLDSVAGSVDRVLDSLSKGRLRAGDILFDPRGSGHAQESA